MEGLRRLEQQMYFLTEIDCLKKVFRQNYLADGSRKENDSEHSWHLAMMVMILSEYFEGLDVLKTLKMVLIHDLVEIYAGDTFAYDEGAHQDKEYRERIAAGRIFSLLPSDQANELTVLWEEFERQDSREALCAATVDRLQPLKLNMETRGRMWREHEVTAEKVLERNNITLEKAPEVIAAYVYRQISEAAERNYFHLGDMKVDSEQQRSSELTGIKIIKAGIKDAAILSIMNHDLIRDEASENPMKPEQLMERMKGFLQAEYKAVLIKANDEVAGYCLYRHDCRLDETGFDIFIRHYYIKTSFRRMGLGRKAFKLLREHTFKNAVDIKLDVLESNPAGRSFWAEMGFEPYSHSLRLKGRNRK